MDVKKLHLFGAILLILFLAVSGYGQQTFSFDRETGGSGFLVDYAQFRGKLDGKTRLEVYYKIYNASLTIINENGKYRGDYEFSMRIYDNKGRQVNAFSRDKRIVYDSYEASNSPDDFRISQIALDLEPGKYKIECFLNDKNSETRIRNAFNVELRKYDDSYPHLSGIEFVRAVDTAIIDSVFIKGNITIIPSVTHKFYGDSTGSVVYYFEIYQGQSELNNTLVETRIMDSHQDVVYRDTVTIDFEKEGDIVRHIRQVSFDSLKSQEYILSIQTYGRRNRVSDEVQAQFNVVWSPGALVLHDFEEALRQLKYIANPDEIKEIRSAESQENKLKAWHSFWASKDPTPATAENEVKDDYYKRIEYANRYFSALKKSGWLTDRGAIFIQYGAPDQVEDYPFEVDSKAYQIWYYYHLKEPRRFVFVDEWGDGDFRLQFPYDGRSW